MYNMATMSTTELNNNRRYDIQAHWEQPLLDLAGDLPHPSTRPIFSYWAGDARLRNAYTICDRITSEHSKSFYMASGLLPEEKRSAVRALYAFCRTVDDIVDGPNTADKDSSLALWKWTVQSSSVGDNDPVAAAWIDTLNRYNIPRVYALQLIEGVARDLNQMRYQSFEDLTKYCYGVASTVGLMSMYIVGFKSTSALPYAIKLGVALQMTNILRDVGEDARNGRVYLPQQELIEHGLCERDILRGVVTDDWREFMRYQITRTRTLYAEAWQGIKFLEREGQMAIAAASEFYSGILDDIEAHDYDVFTRRAGLSPLGKASRIPALWWKLQKM
jgi:15-cis-phytoene synthase